VIDGGKALAGCLLHGACAGAVYRGPYLFAEARATILKFALPVLRQGDLPLLRERRLAVEHLLARSGGLARHALFAFKKRDSPERTQAGAVDRGSAGAS